MVTISKYRIAFPPIRPMVLILPVPAIPTTKVAKMSGAMIDLIRRRKMVPSRPSSFAGPGNAAPNATPATRAIRIQAVRDVPLHLSPHLSFSRSTSKNIMSGGRTRLMQCSERRQIIRSPDSRISPTWPSMVM